MACVLIILVSLCPLIAKTCNINTPYIYNSTVHKSGAIYFLIILITEEDNSTCF